MIQTISRNFRWYLAWLVFASIAVVMPSHVQAQTSTTEPPYVDNRTTPATNFSFLREGRVPDGSTTNPVKGIPIGGVFQYSLQNPATADVDYYVVSVTTGTTAKSYTLANSLAPDTFYTGGTTYKWRVARNIAIALNGTKTVDFTITGLDAQGQPESETVTFTAEAGPKYTVKTFSEVFTVSSTGTSTARNVTVGTGNTFGLPYPIYSNQGIFGVLYDADGADFPNTPLTQGGVLPGGTSTTSVANYVPFASHRVWDAFDTNLPGTAATDDLGLVTLASTVGTDWEVAIQTADMDNNDAVVPYYSAFTYTLPPTYVSGGAVSLVANAGMITTVADVSCTIDFEVFEYGAPTTDLCATAAQSINSLTAADKTFVVTPTNLVAGDQLLVRQTIAGRDNTAAGVTIGRSNSIRFASLQNSGASSASAPLYAFTPGDPTASTADNYGTVLLGASDAVGATGAPNGTADYCIWGIPNDYTGIKTNGIITYDTD